MSQSRRRIAVRLEGGLGDHLLGMRVLPFAREHDREAEVVVYSDAAGSVAQLEVARLSRDADRVVAVLQKQAPASMERMGDIENIEDTALAEIRSADLFLDGWGGGFFISEADALGVPVFEILAARPRLHLPELACLQAGNIAPEAPLIGLNLTKYGGGFLSLAAPALQYILGRLLTVPGLRILHFYRTGFDYAHWPQAERELRAQVAADERNSIAIVNGWSERIIPVADQPIEVVAALLSRCSYYIGVDNGIKHLAWALDIPRSILVPEPPQPTFILRWMPDHHRALHLNGTLEMVYRHAEEAVQYASATNLIPDRIAQR